MRSHFLQRSLTDVKKQLFKQYNYSPSITENEALEILHKRIFCLCSLIYEVSKKDKNKMLFLSELHSDLILLLIVGPLGIKKAISLAIRSSIEDTLRHIYYKDHAIELLLLNESDDNKITDKELFTYVETHPLYRKRNNLAKMLNIVQNIYRDESKQLHSTSLAYFSSLKVISDLSRNSNVLKGKLDNIVDLISALLTLIIIFHKEHFEELSVEKKSLISSCIKSEHKRLIHGID